MSVKLLMKTNKQKSNNHTFFFFRDCNNIHLQYLYIIKGKKVLVNLTFTGPYLPRGGGGVGGWGEQLPF